MRITTLAFTFALPVVLLLGGCGDDAAPTTAWKPVAPAAMSAEQKAQQARGVEAKNALFMRLVARLQAALAEGPGEAIGACKVAAPEIAAAVSEEQALRIGRTSHRLRNPENTVPRWAQSYVDKRTGEPVWLAHADGRLAGLLPIRVMPLCLQCHGAEEAIEPAIRKALRSQYPKDRATGFAAGDLRGWFWLEIPKP